LAHLQTPILVGDPDGCIVYANPAFRSRFCNDGGDPMGQPLAMVFGGGAREVVLTATARVLQRGQSARLQIREGGFGYSGLASPIEAEDDRVGVVMVLLEEQAPEDHLTGLADEVGEPLAEALQTLNMLSENLGNELPAQNQALFERGLQSLETAQKWLRELHVALRGGKAQSGRFDVSAAIQRVTERVRYEGEAGVDLEVLMPPNLPRVAGTTVVFERLLTQLLRRRIEEARSGQPLTVLARTLGGGEPTGVLVSVVDVPDPDRRRATGHPPDVVQQGIASLGGDVACVEDSSLGRVTSLRLGLATAS
jgi:PAS domain-containing protein